jgi:hypothetical protein
MRRLLIFTSVIVFFDVAFYAAIAPLLPDYVHEFGLTPRLGYWPPPTRPAPWPPRFPRASSPGGSGRGGR